MGIQDNILVIQLDGVGSAIKKNYKRSLKRSRRKWNKVDAFVSPLQYQQLHNIKLEFDCALNQLCSNGCRRFIWVRDEFNPVDVGTDWKRVNLVFTKSEMDRIIDLAKEHGTSKRGMVTRILQTVLPFDFEDEDFYTCKEDILLMEKARKLNESEWD